MYVSLYMVAEYYENQSIDKSFNQYYFPQILFDKFWERFVRLTFNFFVSSLYSNLHTYSSLQFSSNET